MTVRVTLSRVGLRRIGLVTAAAATLLCSLAAAGPTGGVTLAASVTPAAALAPAAPSSGQLAPLQEFRTSGDSGWFYTLKPAEAASAVQKFKFTKLSSIGSLYANPVPGGVAVHRLRHKTGGPSYMLSISASEIHDPQFADEGVLGYVDGAQHAGEVRLLRFANQGQWRVLADGQANVDNMKKMGYSVDGALGWYHS